MARLIDRLSGHSDALMPLLRANTQGKLAGTLLFAGPSGIGKRLAALALAQALVCERREPSEPLPCGECGACVRVEKGQGESVLSIAAEGAGIKIDQVRQVLEFISLRRLGRARVVIIDQAHLLNPQAGNALLKSLEEPPEGTHFILVTSLAAAILPTIRSRAQLVRFRPLSTQELSVVLGGEAEDWVLEAAQGSVETAQRLLESRENYLEMEEATRNYLTVAMNRFPSDEITALRELTKDRANQAFVMSLIQGVVRDAIRLRSGLSAAAQTGTWPQIAEAVSNITDSRLSHLADLALGMERDMAGNVERGLVLENFALAWRSEFA